MAVTVSLGRPYACSICSIFLLCMESKALEKSTNKMCCSMVLGNSEVTFLGEGEEAAFCPFLYCVLVIYRVAVSEQ